MSAYIAHLDAAIADLQAQAAALKASGREDEATLARIQLNIHDVCRTVYNVCARSAQGDAMRTMYLEKLDRLPVSWRESLTRARQHGDDCKAIIEEMKIRILEENRAKFLELE